MIAIITNALFLYKSCKRTHNWVPKEKTVNEMVRSLR